MAKHEKVGGWIFKSCLPRCIVSPSAVLIHHDVLNRVGLFDEQLPACEDYDLWLRIAHQYEIGLLDKKLVTRFGGHDDQLSRKYWGMDRFRISAMEKHSNTDLADHWKQPLMKELIFKCGVVAEGALKRGNQTFADLYRGKQASYQKKLKAEFN